MTHIINGKDVAKQLRETLKRDVDALVAEKSITPGLAVILVGDDPASQVYVNSKIKACAATGIHSIERRLPENCERDYLLKTIHDLNADPLVHGILLQLPLPSHLDATEMISHIAPEKDVDGLHPINAGRLMAGLDCLTPCTPQGSLLLINEVEKDLSGMHAVIIGRSLLFGKPMGQILLNENCTVTQCHSRTKNIEEHCKNADILIAAVGRPEMVKADWVNEKAIVIDVGINRRENGTLCGDVDYNALQNKVRAITPVPGGVGPMTIACLLKNTVKAAKESA